MKAYVVNIRENFDAAVVFAETAGKARRAALYTDACDGADFCDIEARRIPKLDRYYKKGKTEMNWENAKDRLALIKVGFGCEHVDLVTCEMCSGKDFCQMYKEAIAEQERKNDT